eukprot:gene20333-24394_t
MSFFDEDIKKSVWEGKIPVVFTLSPNDLTSHLPPSSIALMVPRNSYFPLITNAVRDHFSFSTLVISDELWLEYKGAPLKWHIPVGVLFDTLVGDTGTPTQWNLTVHFQSYPERTLLRCPNEEFWAINKLFYPQTSSGYKHVPIRLVQANRAPVQDLIAPLGDNGTEVTLETLFGRIPFSSIHLATQTQTENLSPTQSSHQSSPPSPSHSTSSGNHNADSFTTLLQYLKSGSGRYCIQGIEPPLESSLVWLSEYFSHPDNFFSTSTSTPINTSTSSFTSPSSQATPPFYH